MIDLYIGFDVGILNLAFCVLNKEEYANGNIGNSIILWKNINLISPEICCGVTKKGDDCGKKASWRESKCHITTFYCKKHKPDSAKVYKQKNSKNVPVETLLELMFTELDTYSETFSKAKSVVIELQPKINPKMKVISAGLQSYFIIRYKMKEDSCLKVIKYSSAKNKLKVYPNMVRAGSIGECEKSDKKGYDRRKDTAQIHTEAMLKEYPEVLEKWYNPEKKKDDLADAFLHCVWSIGTK